MNTGEAHRQPGSKTQRDAQGDNNKIRQRAQKHMNNRPTSRPGTRTQRQVVMVNRQVTAHKNQTTVRTQNTD